MEDGSWYDMKNLIPLEQFRDEIRIDGDELKNLLAEHQFRILFGKHEPRKDSNNNEVKICCWEGTADNIYLDDYSDSLDCRDMYVFNTELKVFRREHNLFFQPIVKKPGYHADDRAESETSSEESIKSELNETTHPNNISASVQRSESDRPQIKELKDELAEAFRKIEGLTTENKKLKDICQTAKARVSKQENTVKAWAEYLQVAVRVALVLDKKMRDEKRKTPFTEGEIKREINKIDGDGLPKSAIMALKHALPSYLVKREAGVNPTNKK